MLHFMSKANLQPQFNFGYGSCESCFFPPTIEKSASLNRTLCLLLGKIRAKGRKKADKVKGNFSFFFYSMFTKGFSSSVSNKIQGSVLSVRSQSGFK